MESSGSRKYLNGMEISRLEAKQYFMTGEGCSLLSMSGGGEMEPQ